MNKWKVIFSLLVVLALSAPALAGYGDYHGSYGESHDGDYDWSNEEPNYESNEEGGKGSSKPPASGSPNIITVPPIDSTTGGNVESTPGTGSSTESTPVPGTNPGNSTSIVAAADIKILVSGK